MFQEEFPNFSRGPMINNLMRTFTQFEARQLEQAVMSGMDSNLNDAEVIIQGQ